MLEGTWHSELADPDGRGIRVGVLSRRAMTQVEQVRGFPDRLDPVQVEDDGTTITELCRPALRVRVHVEIDIDVISVHLKSKLLSFPGGRFNPRDEDERARYAVYALTCFDVRRQEGELAAVTGSVAGSTYRPTCLIPATWRFTRAAVARMAFWRADPLVSGRTPAAGRTRQRQVRHHAPTGGRRGTLRAGRNRRSRPTR
jgi:hypothetical protein